VNAVRLEPERRALRLVLDWLQHQGATFATIAWDRGKVIAFDLEAYGPVHEVEEINRWVLPQRLARWRLGALARFLRNRRVRRWWSAAGPPDLVLLLGPLREELGHYLPPDAGQVIGLLGWRPREEPESLAATEATADRLLVADEAMAAELTGAAAVTTVAPASTVVAPHAAAWTTVERDRLSARMGLRASTTVIVGLGPTDWRGAPDLLLRSFFALTDSRPGLDLHLAWLGGTPDHRDSYPYHFDVHRLGLDGRVHWLGDPTDHVELLARADLVALVGREPYDIPVERRGPEFAETQDLLAWLRVPTVAFDLPADRQLANPWTTLVPYPDTEALARAMGEALASARDEAELPLAEHLAVTGPRLLAGGPA
jgi:glycosyltransferase involved in cell wall biosynthesis